MEVDEEEEESLDPNLLEDDGSDVGDESDEDFIEDDDLCPWSPVKKRLWPYSRAGVVEYRQPQT